MSIFIYRFVGLALLSSLSISSAVAGNFDGSSTSGLWSKQVRLENRQVSIEKRLQRIEQSQKPQYSSEFLRRFGTGQIKTAPASTVTARAVKTKVVAKKKVTTGTAAVKSSPPKAVKTN